MAIISQFALSGGVWTDVTGSNNLTATGTVAQGSGFQAGANTAAVFNGTTGNYLSRASGSVVGMNALSALTVAFRFKIAVAGVQMLVTKYNNLVIADQTFAAFTNAGTLRFIVGDGTTIVVAASTTTLSTGVWYSAVCSYDGVNAEVYIDSEVTPSGTVAFTGTLANSASPFAIGTRSDGAAVFNGTVDDVIIADHAFTSAERTSYNALSEKLRRRYYAVWICASPVYGVCW